MLKWLGKRRYTILFVDGAHENFKELNSYPIEEWNGGKTRHISGRLRQLMRGEIFTLDGKKLFAFGGGMLDETFLSKEKYENSSSPEVPTAEEFEYALKNLENNGNTVDYIASYEAPGQIAGFIELSKSEEQNLNAFFDRISEACTFSKWYFGQHHIDKIITAKYMAVYNKIAEAEQGLAPKK